MLAARGLVNAEVRHAWAVPCFGGKNRYGYRWTAQRRVGGQTVTGEACAGGFFQKTVIK